MHFDFPRLYRDTRAEEGNDQGTFASKVNTARATLSKIELGKEPPPWDSLPAIALLVLLIRPMQYIGLQGIGPAPAIVALFLYSLLPIVRNTFTGLRDISPSIRESAEALGLPPGARLRLAELPIAARTILAGIKTAAVINVGFATLGGFIGAGGFGEPIFTGIRLNDPQWIAMGAIPAALLALLVQGLFEVAERALVPKGLRLPDVR